MNNEILENPTELKQFKQIYKDADYRVIDIGWWNKKVLILTRGTGLLSLVSSSDLSNLMGRNQQWVTPYASLFPYQKNEFIILNCYCTFANNVINTSDDYDDLIQQNNSSMDELSDNQENDEDEEEDGWLSYAKETLRSQAYNLSGLERLAPKPKKPKILKRKYSILHIKSTTPEELFERKLNLEEYGEALQLAKSYNLDTDLVYQKQWRLKPITKSTIIDYLSKIKKRSWVLHECEERISPNIDTTKYLLDFGLQGTDLDILLAIKEKDDNKFIYSKAQIRKNNNFDSESEEDEEDEVGIRADKFNPEFIKRQKRKQEEARQHKIKKIDFNNLTLMQKELLAARSRLLKYMDRLILYEQILGGPRKAADLFDPEKYAQMRSKPILEVAFDFARESNAYAVEIILSYFHKELQSKQLEIFSNFPEFLDPDKYVRLLPRLENGTIVRIFNEPDTLRDQTDWIEIPEFQNLLDKTANEKDNNDDLNQQPYDIETVQNWYYNRTIEIEKYSGLVDVALNFAEIAIGNEFNKNMSNLVENLRTLSTLIYECQKTNQTETFYTLDFVTELKDIEKLQLIMSHSYDVSTDMFMKNLQDWFLPFLMRKPTINLREKLIREYLIKVSKDDLNTCHKLFNLKLKYIANPSMNQNSIQFSHMLQEVNLISIIIDCLYENDKPEQLDLCKIIINDILNCNEKIAKYVTDTSNHNQSLNSTNKLQLTHQQQLKVKLAQDHLKACEMFRKYGLNKTLSYVRDSCLNEENCRDSLIKLTWFASKRATHLKMNEWIDLMKDLQNLQNNLFKNLISYQDCTEIFLSSLIGSRNLDNINLAADWLRDIYIVDKEAAVQLGIKSAQEYFNSSSNYHDPDMNFAKECINLVKCLISSKPSQEILQELANNDLVIQKCLNLINHEEDLIMSMKLIAEFDYTILPVQVRSSEQPLEIIKDILKKNENSYKDYDKFIQLANYLNHKSAMNEQADVILLIAEHSLNKHNLYVLTQMCKHLVRLNYSPAWSCVHKLVFHLCQNLVEQFKIHFENESQIYEAISRHCFDFKSNYGSREKTILNLADIEKLLSFSLTHCDSSKIEEILNEKLLIEKARLNLERLASNMDSLDEDEEIDENKLSFNKLSFDYFNSMNDFDQFESKNNQVKFIINSLLKLNKNDLKSIIKYLNKLSKIDANLALAYMLELDDLNLDLFSNSFQFDSTSSISYEFLLYLFGLNMINNFNDNDLNDKSYHYLLKPSSLNSLLDMINYDDSLDIIRNQSKCQKSLKNYQKINKLYTEYNQNNSLKELNAGIDLKRFETDQSYKHDTIMGLCLDVKTFDLACSLARFYSFDIWKVYMSFTEYLLTEVSDMDLTEIDKKLQPLLSILKTKPDQFKSSMFDNVYTLIDGLDLDKLVLFYSLLDGVDQDAITHVKILKKIKTLSLNGLDYKNLLEKPIEIIEIYLNESNLQFFAKLLPKLPINNKNLKLNSSKIHVIWCLKKIWPQEEEQDVGETIQINESTFLDNIENLSESIKKLDMETDFIYFVKELNLNKKSVYNLNTHIRKEVNKKMLRILKQQSNNSEKLIKELNKISSHVKMVESIEKLGIETKYSKLLDLNLGSILIENDENTTNEDEIKQIKINKLEDVLVEMFLDGVQCEVLNDIINLFELKDVINIKLLVKLCLNKISNNLKKKKKDHNEELVKVKTLLDNISSHLNKNENLSQQQVEVNSKKKKKNQPQEEQPKQRLITEEDVMECIRSFCNDQQIDLNIRLLILEDIKDSFKNIRDEDLMILLIYKTNAILTNVDCFDKKCDLIDSSMIQNESQRLELIFKFIDLSATESHCMALVKILNIWPQFSSIEDQSQKPWINVLIKHISNSYSFINLAKDLIKNNQFNQDDLFYVKSQLEENSNWDNDSKYMQLKLSYLKLLFLFKNLKLIKEFINESIDLSVMDQIQDNLDHSMIEANEQLNAVVNDKELMNLLINEKFYLDIINTRFYCLFEWYLINNETRPTIREVIRELKMGLHLEEAGKLLLQSESFYDSYKILSVSLTLIDKFE